MHASGISAASVVGINSIDALFAAGFLMETGRIGASFCWGMQVVKLSFVEQICNAYGDGLAAGLRSDRAHPCRTAHQIEELARAYELGLRDGAIMRERKRRLDAGGRVYQ